MNVHEFWRMKSPEAGELRSEGRAIGLIPLGAVEQHGPHLPLATDAIIADHLGKQVAARLREPVLLAPTLPGGLSWHHLGFPGTVDLSKDVLGGFIQSYIATMVDLGIRDVAIFSAHGGNFGFIGDFARTYADANTELRVIAYDDLERYLAVMAKASEQAGLTVPETDAHAGGLETSQMMFLLGEDEIQVPQGLEGYTEAEPGWIDKLLTEGMRSLTPVGVLGRPAGASARVGEAICAALVDELVEWMVSTLELAEPIESASPEAVR